MTQTAASKARTISLFTLACSAAAVALVAAGCAQQSTASSDWAESNLVYGRRVHALPMRDSSTPTPTAHTGGPLTYFGGRVVSNMQVVQVLYGSGSYNAQVAGTSTPSIATFYQGILNSPYVDWLTE